MAEVETSVSIKTVRLIPEEKIAEWLIKDNPAMAIKLSQVGIRAYLHQLAGFKVSSTAVVQPSISNNTLSLLLEKIDNLSTQVALSQEVRRSINILEDNFQGVHQLIQDSLYETQTKHYQLLKIVYANLGVALNVNQVFSIFYKGQFTSASDKRIINKVRCNINGCYFDLTRKLLPTKNGAYVFDSSSILFLLWKIDTIILRLGYNQGNIAESEVTEILKHNTL